MIRRKRNGKQLCKRRLFHSVDYVLNVINELLCHIATTSSKTCFPILCLRLPFSTKSTLTPKMPVRQFSNPIKSSKLSLDDSSNSTKISTSLFFFCSPLTQEPKIPIFFPDNSALALPYVSSRFFYLLDGYHDFHFVICRLKS